MPIALVFTFALVLGVPLLRDIWLIQATGRSPLYPGWGRLPFHGDARIFQANPQFLPPRRVAGPHDGPRDEPGTLAVALFVRAAQATDSPTATLPELCRELDSICLRFPEETWLRALRLRWSLQWMQHNRLAGELSDLDLAAHRARGIASPEKTNSGPNFTAQQLNEAINCARLGQKSEPDNAFWDWMLAQFYVYGWRDAQAWRALENGARKTRFETHEAAWLRVLLAEKERQLSRSLLAEEKAFVWQNNGASTQGGRGIGRLIAWQTVKARRRGDHQTALRVLAALVSLQNLRARHTYSQRESYVAANIAVFSLAHSTPWGLTAPSPFWNLEVEAQRRSNDFMRYAAAQGQGAKARRLVAETALMAREVEQALRAENVAPQTKRSAVWRFALGTYGASNLLWQQAALCGALWLLLGIMWRVLALPRVNLGRSDRACGVLLLLGLLLALAAGGGVQIAQVGSSFINVPLGLDGLRGSGAEVASLLLPFGIVIPALFASFLVQGLTQWRSSERAEKAPSWRERCGQFRPAPFLCALTLGLFSFAMLVWWQAALLDSAAAFFVPRAVAGFSLGTLGGRSLAYGAVHPNWPLAALLLGLAAGWLRWIFAAAPHRRPVVLYRLCWLRELLWVAALLGVTFFGFANWAAVPARRAAEADFQRLLWQGDNPLRPISNAQNVR